MHVRTYLFVTLLAATAAMGNLAAAQSFPRPAGRVNDFAGVIDPAAEAELDSQLNQLEQKTTAEIAVATIRSLDGIPIEDYANRLFKEWGIGQAKDDNGVLVLIAVDDREIKIEVGYGLEGVLPDGLAGQVIRDHFTPKFKANDYSGGVRDGVTRLVEIVEQQHVLTPEERARFGNADDVETPLWIVLPFLGVFVTIGCGLIGVGLRTRTFFALLFGAFFGGMPLLIALLLAPAVSGLTLLPWSVLMGVVGYRLGGRQSWKHAFRERGGGSSSGWTTGSSSGSGSSSSSSSSSDSFGGGSSGGGGASGRW
jgi:uncharacterized protein